MVRIVRGVVGSVVDTIHIAKKLCEAYIRSRNAQLGTVSAKPILTFFFYTR